MLWNFFATPLSNNAIDLIVNWKDQHRPYLLVEINTLYLFVEINTLYLLAKINILYLLVEINTLYLLVEINTGYLLVEFNTGLIVPKGKLLSSKQSVLYLVPLSFNFVVFFSD